MRVQMANETILCAEESWVVRTKNDGGSGWCSSAFSKFPMLLSYCNSSGFPEFRSTFDNFTPFVSVLRQIFPVIRVDTKRIHVCSLSLSLSHYLYNHQQTDCFVVSQLFSLVRHVGCLKLGSKPTKIHVRLSILPLGPQVNHVSSGIIRHYVAAQVCLHFCLAG